ncbi:MAG: hypothetical protein ACLFP8_00380 [Alphaproteobacteria bacterium]
MAHTGSFYFDRGVSLELPPFDAARVSVVIGHNPSDGQVLVHQPQCGANSHDMYMVTLGSDLGPLGDEDTNFDVRAYDRSGFREAYPDFMSLHHEFAVYLGLMEANKTTEPFSKDLDIVTLEHFIRARALIFGNAHRTSLPVGDADIAMEHRMVDIRDDVFAYKSGLVAQWDILRRQQRLIESFDFKDALDYVETFELDDTCCFCLYDYDVRRIPVLVSRDELGGIVHLGSCGSNNHPSGEDEIFTYRTVQQLEAMRDNLILFEQFVGDVTSGRLGVRDQQKAVQRLSEMGFDLLGDREEFLGLDLAAYRSTIGFRKDELGSIMEALSHGTDGVDRLSVKRG